MQVCSNGCRMPNGKPRTAPRTSVIDGKRRLCRQCAAEEAELDERAVRQRRREVALIAEQAEQAEAEKAAAASADSPASASAAKASNSHAKDKAKSSMSKKRKNTADNNIDASSDDDRRRRIIRSRIDMSFFTYPGFFWVDDIPPQAGAELRTRAKGDGRDDHCDAAADMSEKPAEDKESRKITDKSKRKAAASVDAGLGANDDAASAKKKSSPSKKARGNGPTSESGKSPVRRASPKRAAKEKSSNGAATDSDHVFEGRWTEAEVKRLARGIRAHGHQWKKVAACVRTRSPMQCKSKNQKLINAHIDSWQKRGK